MSRSANSSSYVNRNKFAMKTAQLVHVPMGIPVLEKLTDAAGGGRWRDEYQDDVKRSELSSARVLYS